MLEIFSGKSSPTPTPPKYGPGPQTLIYGDETYGYFGKVTDATMGIGKSISDSIALSTKYFVNSPTNSYGKFIRKGRVLFVPLFAFGVGTYPQAHAARMNYNPTGPANELPPLPLFRTTANLQAYTVNRKFTTLDGSTVIVRNMTMGDGVGTVTYTGDSPTRVPSEIVDLIYKPYAPANKYAGPWKLPASDLSPVYTGNSNPEVMVATWTHDPNTAYGIIISPDHSRFNIVNAAGSTKQLAWCPVIEFIPADQVPNLPA